MLSDYVAFTRKNKQLATNGTVQQYSACKVFLVPATFDTSGQRAHRRMRIYLVNSL